MNNYGWKKNIFDRTLALVLILFFLPFLFLFYLICSVDTQTSGVFKQKRVGRFGRLFTIYKFQTIHPKTREISNTGASIRKYKLDELPQLFNILTGDMSFVGPRPDLEGYYDKLQGDDRRVLQLRPGLTSEASLKYRNEEYILSQQENPLEYNDTIIFPDKVKMNLYYLEKMSFREDYKIIIKTIYSILYMSKYSVYMRKI